MEHVKLPFQMEDKKVLNELLENLNVVLKDSDALEEKEFVKRFLHLNSTAIVISTIGKSGVGKSTLLSELFGKKLGEVVPTNGIVEFRYGAENCSYYVTSNVVRHFKMKPELEGVVLVDTVGCEKWEQNGIEENAKEYLERSDAILVVLEAAEVNVNAVWSILEEIQNKNIIFILSKIETIDEEKLEESKLRLRQYMLEAEIQAPVFSVSVLYDACAMEELVSYIKNNVICSNVKQFKEQENIQKLTFMLRDLNESFELRKRQYIADVAILDKIDFAMNGFREKSRSEIEYLKNEISKEIDEVVDAYQNEIIQRLDAKKIKERFSNGKDEFMEYLELVNESYQRRMTDEVNKRVIGYIRVYLTNLQAVFEEATGYFRTRQSLLLLEDKFYGTLAETKRNMVNESSSRMEEIQKYYITLNEASEELYEKMWNTREKHDQRVKVSSTISGVIGGTTGAVGTAMWATNGLIASFLSANGATATAVMVITAPTMIIPIASGSALFGVLSYKLVEKVVKKISTGNLEKKMEKYIEEFKVDVANTKEKMKEQILENVEKMFIMELDSADKSFADFRISVNIDKRNIPKLELRMEKMKELLQQYEQLERE